MEGSTQLLSDTSMRLEVSGVHLPFSMPSRAEVDLIVSSTLPCLAKYFKFLCFLDFLTNIFVSF